MTMIMAIIMVWSSQIKLLERMSDFYICGMVNIYEWQFGFGRVTIEAIFIVHQLQK